MRILAYGSPHHDGTAALVEGNRLVYALESEKDDWTRYASLSPTLVARSLEIGEIPDVIAVSGFIKHTRRPSDDTPGSRLRVGGGYFDESAAGKMHATSLFAGKTISRFSSSHVRSHIMCAYGMSPFSQGRPCYALIWEGNIGAFYYLDEEVRIKKVADVLDSPGLRYQLLYSLADPTVPIESEHWIRLDDAGKLMAIAAYGTERLPSAREEELISRVMNIDIEAAIFRSHTPMKSLFRGSPYLNVGVESQEFKDLAWQFSNALFARFHTCAKERISDRLPLLVAGGCGLNCEWNTRWKQSNLFDDVFVPPCANDSGIAIGAAIDALQHYTNSAKVEWSAYAGDPFVDDIQSSSSFGSEPLNLPRICQLLRKGAVIAWVQGRYEIGPRALGNRSLLAEPFSERTRDRLNSIKQREPFRPIAPICLLDDFDRCFENHGPSPHMLYFQRVKSPELRAVTHVDGSARAQSVTDEENSAICNLLREFRRQSGFGVLCNTSLNFKGYGFINHLSQLLEFVRAREIDGAVVGDRFWTLRPGT